MAMRMACGLIAAVIAVAACKSKHDDEPAKAPPAPAVLDAAVAPIAQVADAAPEGAHALALSVCPKVTAPYLFRVEKGGHTSYLLGTRHLGIGLDRMPPIVSARLEAAKLAVFEVAPGDDTQPDETPGPSLADAVGADGWTHYRELVGDEVATVVEHEKPSVALIMMMAAFEDPTTSLDQELEDLATRDHVATRGLEKSSFQDGLIEQLLDVRALRAAIGSTKARAELRQDTVDDLGDYCRGDKMDRGTKDEDDLRKAGYTDAEVARYDDLLLFGRNRAWVPQLEPIFDRGDAFVAVGLDHLLGDGGLIAAFGKDGYQVTRVTP